MKQRLKIIVSLLYAAIFLVFAGTGALATQAGEEKVRLDEMLTLDVVEEIFFTDLACYGNYREWRQSY